MIISCRLSSIFFSVFALSSCATAPDVKDMVVDAHSEESRTYDQNLHNQIIVKSVSGGDITNPMWTSEIESEGFKKALVESLKAAGLLSPDENAANFQLSVEILAVDQPMFGFDLTVTASVKYVLKAADKADEILHETLISKHTATMSDAFYGPERLKIANEGAVKNNIRQLLDELSKLTF